MWCKSFSLSTYVQCAAIFYFSTNFKPTICIAYIIVSHIIRFCFQCHWFNNINFCFCLPDVLDLQKNPEVASICNRLQSPSSETDDSSASISGTPIAIAIIITFLLTAAAVAFLAVVIGLVIHSYVSRKQEDKTHTNGYSHRGGHSETKTELQLLLYYNYYSQLCVMQSCIQ